MHGSFAVLFGILGLSALLTLVLYVCVRRKVPGWVLFVVGVLPILLTYLCNPNIRVYSAHGYFHTSIVNEILNGNLPPGNPLLSGERLCYHWAYHAITALICQGIRISPFTAFVALNIVTLGLTLTLLSRTAKVLGYDRGAQILAAVLAVYGFSFFNRGPISTLLYSVPRPDFLGSVHSLGIPPQVKFLNANPMPLGLASFALFLYSLIGLVSRPDRRGRMLLCLAASYLLSAVLYSPVFFAIALSSAVSCLALLLGKGRAAFSPIRDIVVSLCLCSVLVYPFLRLIGSIEAGSAMTVNHDFPTILSSHANYVVVVIPLAFVFIVERAALVRLFRANPDGARVLLMTVLTTALLYVWVSAKGNEYKFLTLSCMAVGMLAAVCVRDLLVRRPVVGVVCLAIFLVPASTDLFDKWTWGSAAVADCHYVEGRYLRPADEAKHELLTWIRANTPRDGVFIDSERSVPVIAMRRMYLGVDDPLPTPSGSELQLDGWAMDTEHMLKYFSGQGPDFIAERQKVVEEMLAENNCRLSAKAFRALEKAHPDEDIFVVARAQKMRDRYEGDHRFEKLFENRSAAVFRLGKATANRMGP